MKPEESLDGHARRSLETRRKLLSAARSIFTEVGYMKASTPAIAKAAGVSRGALYHQYADKEALFRDLLNEMQAEIYSEIEKVALAADDLVNGLIEGAMVYVEAAARPDYLRIVLTEGPSVMGTDQWREADRNNGVQSLIDGFSAAQAAGDMRDFPVEEMAHLFSGALDACVLHLADAKDRAGTIKNCEKAIRTLVTGLGK
ncbi:TetR/AcrR family transcriptional regulator [Aestuariispira insulae]|uniref:TetR family transcriptional regulator n=1 Tax=Aestuariispira insulae TaxID=1461337 RepID=A0A3D9HKS6_9PROT|nr:TetR/AcrR family transcriptional regulator [Aestuariispira insulae]RED49901.1 TetR family transcriptional regulator [Aestuariispira insulae]